MAGYPPFLTAVQDKGLLSIEPGPTDALEANGRYVVVDGHVMFVTQEQNHATALTGSGFAPLPGTTVGFYTARRATTTDAWRFISISHFSLGGNRARPDPATWTSARSAFLRSDYGDVANVLTGPRA